MPSEGAHKIKIFPGPTLRYINELPNPPKISDTASRAVLLPQLTLELAPQLAPSTYTDFSCQHRSQPSRQLHSHTLVLAASTAASLAVNHAEQDDTLKSGHLFSAISHGKLILRVMVEWCDLQLVFSRFFPVFDPISLEEQCRHLPLRSPDVWLSVSAQGQVFSGAPGGFPPLAAAGPPGTLVVQWGNAVLWLLLGGRIK